RARDAEYGESRQTSSGRSSSALLWLNRIFCCSPNTPARCRATAISLKDPPRLPTRRAAQNLLCLCRFHTRFQKPFFLAISRIPPGSLIHPEIWFSYFRMISKLQSVEPPSSMKYSRLGYLWTRTDRIVCSRYFPELKTGVTRAIREFGGCSRADFHAHDLV